MTDAAPEDFKIIEIFNEQIEIVGGLIQNQEFRFGSGQQPARQGGSEPFASTQGRDLLKNRFFREQELCKSISDLSFLLEIVAPLLREVGQKVATGELDVYHEHAASAIIRNFLTGLLYTAQRLPKAEGRPQIVFATPEGDHHEFGILIAAILLALRGTKVLYLGPNMPSASLASAVAAVKADILVLSCSAPKATLSPADLKKFVTSMATQLNPRASLWFGGPRVSEIASLAPLLRRNHALLNRFEDLDRLLKQHQIDV